MTVFLVGGTVALSTDVENAVRAGGYGVGRAAEPNRYSTAVEVARIADDDSPPHVMVANGGRDDLGLPAFQDALVAGAAAGEFGVVLLSDGSRMPDETANYINDEAVGQNYYAVGSEAQAAYPDGIAVGGTDVYATSVAMADRFSRGFTTFGVASGERFPDALAGGGHAGRLESPLLLSRSDGLPDVVLEYLAENARETAFVYGGTDAIDESISLQIGVSDYQTNCGGQGGILFGVECRVTMSRVATQQWCDEWCDREAGVLAGGSLATLFCGVVGGVAALGCGIALNAGRGFFSDLRRAAEQGDCFAFGYLYSALVGPAGTVLDPTEIKDGPICDDVSRIDPQRRTS